MSTNLANTFLVGEKRISLGKKTPWQQAKGGQQNQRSYGNDYSAEHKPRRSLDPKPKTGVVVCAVISVPWRQRQGDQDFKAILRQ